MMTDAKWTDGFDGPSDDEFGTFHRLLTPDIVPRSDAPYCMDIAEFALTFDGYSAQGGFDELAALAQEAGNQWHDTGELPGSLVDLRSCLFFEQRVWRQSDDTPEGRELDYIRALVEAIRAWAETGAATVGR